MFTLLLFQDKVKWIDVNPINSDLLASGGDDGQIRIYDKRNSQIVRTFGDVHICKRIQHPPNVFTKYYFEILVPVNCVQWSPRGDKLASSCIDGTGKSLRLSHLERSITQELH